MRRNQFVRRGTPIRRGGISPVNRGGVQRPRPNLYSSSSSESYNINDDIPMINEEQQKQTSKAAALLSESSFTSDDQEIISNRDISAESKKIGPVSDAKNTPNNKGSWKPSNTPNKQKNNDSYDPRKGNSNETNLNQNQKRNNYSYSYEYEYDSGNKNYDQNSNTNDSQDEPILNQDNSSSQIKHVNSSSQIKHANSSSQIKHVNSSSQIKQDNSSSNNVKLNEINNSSSNTNLDLNENCGIKKATTTDFERWIERSDAASIENKTTINLPPEPKKNSLIFHREKGSLIKKENYRLLENQRIIYFSSESKDQIGHFTIISKQNSCIVEESESIGILRQNSKSTKFLFVSNETKPHDDREGEIFGICFKNQTVGKFKVKVLNIALIADKKPYFSISKRLSLTSVASGDTEGVPNVIQFTSKLPEINEKGKLTLNLGNVFLVPSSKNMAICNENGEIIFNFYKINEGSFSVHCVPPIDQLTAFGICIAIVKGM